MASAAWRFSTVVARVSMEPLAALSWATALFSRASRSATQRSDLACIRASSWSVAESAMALTIIAAVQIPIHSAQSVTTNAAVNCLPVVRT